MKIGVVTVNFNQEDFTKNFLSSLNNINKGKADLEVFVVNNGSEELVLDEDEYKNIKINILVEENKGFAGGCNAGIKLALEKNSDFVLIINNDTSLDPNFLQNLFSSFGSEAGIISPKIYFAKGREFHKDRYKKDQLGKVIWYAGGVFDKNNILASHRGVDEVDHGQFDRREETDFATGCAMLIKKEVFDKIGLFDEKYFLYLEDLDLSTRAKKAGFKIFFEPSSIVWHYNAGSTGGSGSELQDYFITRNRMLFGFKYSSLRARIALMRESIRFLMSGRKAQKIGISDFYLRKLGKGSFVK